MTHLSPLIIHQYCLLNSSIIVDYCSFNRSYSMMTRILSTLIKPNYSSSYPKFTNQAIKSGRKLTLITSSEAEKYVPQAHIKEFKDEGQVEYEDKAVKNTVVSQKIIEKGLTINKNTMLEFSQQIKNKSNFKGIASSTLASAFKFSRKQKPPKPIEVQLPSFEHKEYILQLTHTMIRSKQWANMRGNQATPEYFLEYCNKLAKQLPIKIKVIRGKQLLDEDFGLMHAVGRASKNEPIFINLSYQGNPSLDEWHSFVGKGVCFDSGGLNLKPASGIKNMHMDKHGSTSILSAFESAVRMNLKVNITASLGYVENSISENAYRPSDIIKSRKGLTVLIENTDAEGRLVLADCMNWTQQKFKVKSLIQLSTLTGAIVVALGRKHAGLFSNSNDLSFKFLTLGEEVGELAWRMPVDSYHHEMIKAKQADISNAPGKVQASSCQAAAFLQNFVEDGVSWIHLDIAGVAYRKDQSTGYGARVLLNYLKNCSQN